MPSSPIIPTHPRLAGASPAAISSVPAERVRTDGKFFRVGAQKFCPKGVTYGPFRPNTDGSTVGTPERVAKDFELMKKLNANCIRVYHLPPRWFLDFAQEKDLKVLVDYAWPNRMCFLDDAKALDMARHATREAAEKLAGHPAVFALTLANEIPPDIARWYGAPRIEEFLDSLVSIVKSVDPQRLVTFVNYPPTEFLQPQSVDFLSFNVYLHDQKPFATYLDRLQGIAGAKPLMLAEMGMDSNREGEKQKSWFLGGHIELAFRAGLAGVFVFSLTDDWFTGGAQIEDWQFGLTDRDRNPRPSFNVVAEKFAQAPRFPLASYPKVSVVVASYNGGRTLPACLESLKHLNYSNYEVILVDDGSTDNTPQIAARHPEVRTIHQPNLGLSAARNTGIRAAAGEIVAFTDSDCRVDEDWLHYLIGDLLKTDAAAIGGHNFPPPEDNWIAGTVAASPGGPAHVMLNDREAEHIPGCNMAFWKWALDEINGFDSIYRAAGDDVDVCWRLMDCGYKIAFSHSGFVWHYRRNSVAAYLKQQRGYGVAEVLLRFKHPKYFNSIGGMRWRGRIYNPIRSSGLFGRFVVYHGVFGSGLFQSLYTSENSGVLTLMTSLEWHVLVTLNGVLLAMLWPALWPLPTLTFLASIGVSSMAAGCVDLQPSQRRFWSRPMIALLHILQPVVRAWPKYAYRLKRRPTPNSARATVTALACTYRKVGHSHTLSYWSDYGIDRFLLIDKLLEILQRDEWQNVADSGWDEFDITIHGDRLTKVLLHTVSENHGGEKRLVRVRASAHWTLLAKVWLWSVVSLVAFFVMLTSRAWWALPAWLLVLLMTLYLYLRARRTLRLALGVVDLAAQQIGLTKFDDVKKS